jgi:hypothetical protein
MPEIWVQIIFKKLPKENNRPIGKKSPNRQIVALFDTSDGVCQLHDLSNVKLVGLRYDFKPGPNPSIS